MGLSFVAAFYILRYPAFANSIFILIGFLSLLYFIYTASQETEPQLVRQVWVICLLCIISVMFWALYFQMFLSLTLFISRVVQPVWLNIHFPPPYYVSIQSLGAIVFGFLILAKRKHKASLTQHKVQAGHKFIAAMFFMTIAYIIIAAVCRFTAPDQFVSPLYIIPAYLMISLAELYLYPVGLSAITVLSDRNRVSTMMGIFLVSLGVGGFISGKLAYLTAVPLEETSIINLKAHYAHAFDQLLYILLSALILCIFIGYFIKRLLTKAV